MDRLNSEHVLYALRNDHRVPQPKLAKHRLIRAMRKELGIPIYYFRRRRGSIRSGSAPGNSFYEDGAYYIHVDEARNRNQIVHELAHGFVAREQGKLNRPNFGLDQFQFDDGDEVSACKIELFLSFLSGFYSWEVLGDYAETYMLLEDLYVALDNDGRDENGTERFDLDARSRSDAIEFALDFRDEALKFSGVQSVCDKLELPTGRGHLADLVVQNWRA